MKIKIVCEDKYLPTYANETDACMDVKACIKEGERKVHPNETIIVNSGIKVAIPEGYVMLMFVRSSVGIKRNLMLANGTGVIDAGYRDEIKVALHNIGEETEVIKDGERIAQFIVLPFPKLELLQVEDNLVFRKGDRGGGIGSSGT